MILYIAGPMTGIAEQNYPAFRYAQNRLEKMGYTVLSPVDVERENPTPGLPQSWEWYMRRAIKMLLEAEAVALLDGWEQSRGAKREYGIAADLGMHIETVDIWVMRAELGIKV